MNVVITGATKGIGRAIAHVFAAAGHTIITCSRSEKDLVSMSGEWSRMYPSVKFYHKQTDVASKTELNAFASWMEANEIVTNILINNAGLFVPGSTHNEKEGQLEEMMNVNLFAPYHLTRLLLPGMMANKKGHIFNICSIASIKAFDNVGAYGISKFALLGFTKNLREEMKQYNIKVTAVIPGSTMTASWDGSGVSADRIMEDTDVAKMVFAASQLSAQAVVEDMVLRPQLGDL